MVPHCLDIVALGLPPDLVQYFVVVCSFGLLDIRPHLLVGRMPKQMLREESVVVVDRKVWTEPLAELFFGLVGLVVDGPEGNLPSMLKLSPGSRCSHVVPSLGVLFDSV